MIRSLKRVLGFCECDKCLNRSYAKIRINVNKSEKVSRDICEKHMKELIKDVELKSITIEV